MSDYQVCQNCREYEDQWDKENAALLAANAELVEFVNGFVTECDRDHRKGNEHNMWIDNMRIDADELIAKHAPKEK